jgi:hypothetical protein
VSRRGGSRRGGSRRGHGRQQGDGQPTRGSDLERRDPSADELASQLVNRAPQRNRCRPIPPLADEGGAGEQAGEIIVRRTDRPLDVGGGLEADRERVFEGDREGGVESGESPVGRAPDVSPREQRPRKHRPDQRHFPFDA